MGGSAAPLSGPDLAEGVPVGSILEGKPLLGHAGGEAVLLARSGDELFAVSATCPHYGAPLIDGIQVGQTVRCPWHHARFDLRTGALACAPALNPLTCYAVERSGNTVRVTGKRQVPGPAPSAGPAQVVIIGAGAAGHSAAETLRREGYQGSVTVIGADQSVPYDRPNLSKDYLAGNAPEEWIPLRGRDFYAEQKIDLRTGVRATAIDVAARTVALSDGTRLPFEALLLATGAEPVRPTIPGGDLPHVYTLRTLADSRAIIARAQSARRAVVLGASFIGMEVAASLRARGLEVHVVAPQARPLERVLGPEVGDFVRALHEAKGVIFHLGQLPTSIDAERGVTLQNGEVLPADIVVAGLGVRPALALAESAGLALDNGVKVNAYLETSVPGIWAAGDIARWPDRHTGQSIRVEHWVVAQRQGQTAARNMLGRREKFDAVPFFWSAHYDVVLSYVGHAQAWDSIETDGSLAERNCTLRYKQGGRTLAVLTVGRDAENLRIEAALESA
jgi:NADPH-dependent 2,4-dienoyl-CoA reductase/sulfur reductase-like enzyme/nitrite reductase/ring-hydroxylating ferredoxin subunit